MNVPNWRRHRRKKRGHVIAVVVSVFSVLSGELRAGEGAGSAMRVRMRGNMRDGAGARRLSDLVNEGRSGRQDIACACGLLNCYWVGPSCF